MWVYINSEKGLWTVGFYDPTGKWHSDSDHEDQEEAADRVHWLNGGEQEQGRISVTVVPITPGDGNLPASFFS